MFVVKNPEVFASEIIPQYFDHNKFSSFARQLNFYGFRKIQTKPIRNEDFDKSTAKHVTFFNEKFKRGRYDLLKEIQRSTRGGGAQASLADQQREMETLRSTVSTLEQRVADLEARWQDHAAKTEREIHAKVELAMMDLLSSRGGGGGMHMSSAAANVAAANHAQTAAALQAQYMGMPSLPTSFGDAAMLQRAERSFGSVGRNPATGTTWENPVLSGSQAARAFSTASASSLGGGGAKGGATSGGGTPGGPSATLPPHPKQKSLPPPLPSSNSRGGGMGMAAQAADPRASGGMQGGLHTMSGGMQGGLHTMPGGLRNAWEDKFFSTLMMTDGASRAASLVGLANGMGASMAHHGGGGMAHGGNVSSGLAALAAAHQMQNSRSQAAQQQREGKIRRSCERSQSAAHPPPPWNAKYYQCGE